MSGALVKAPAATTSTKSALKSRRGFGLFDSDEEESEAERKPREPVRFSGDLSGFASMSDNEGPSRERSRSPTKTSSRTSTLTTPSRSRKNSVAGRRSTPYNSTTSRALQRAKRVTSDYSENEEEQLISESVFDATPAKKTRFGGSRAYSEDEQEQSTEVDTDNERGRSQIPRKAKSVRQEQAQSNQQPAAKGVVAKTWGQWLKSFIPALAGPVEPESTHQLAIEYPETPEYEYSLSIPGSYEKEVYKGENYINPNIILNHDSQRTPIRSIDGLFQYNHSPDFGFSSPGSANSQSPASPVKKGSRAPTAPTSAKRMLPTPPVPSYRKPSNFIERMRNAKSKKRYDPYSRPSSSPRKGAPPGPAKTEEVIKDLSPEEQLELLERREKDRKVQEAEDRYLRRETLRRLGRPVEDEDMSDTPADTPTKSKARAATVEDMEEDTEFQRSSTPPDSPPQKSASLFKTGGAPLFQFPNTAPKPTFTSTSEKKSASESDTTDKPQFLFGTNPSFGGDSDNDKENVHNPPPPPTMSHRELPSPPIPAPAPPAINGGLFGGKQPIGGFGISEAPAPPSYSPVSPVPRQRFDKFKPRVSSGLRESATIEKENEHDKENPTDFNSTNGEESSGKASKAPFGAQAAAKPTLSPSGGALREAGPNAVVGSGVKFDVRSKIATVGFLQNGGRCLEGMALTVAQLPVKELCQIMAWPGAKVVVAGDAAMRQAVRDAWSAQEGWMGEWADDVFGGARSKVAMI